MNRGLDLETKSVGELVGLFVDYAVQQDDAMLGNEQAKVNTLFWKIESIKTELKSRPGDQRAALISLFAHSNPQVQIKAAKATLAIAPAAARQVLENLSATCNGPQKLDAGMTIWALDSGMFKPS